MERCTNFSCYKKDIDYVIIGLSKKSLLINEVFKLANKLRKDKKVEIVFGKLSKNLEYANIIGAKKAIILGEKDLNKKFYTEKDLISGKQFVRHL